MKKKGLIIITLFLFAYVLKAQVIEGVVYEINVKKKKNVLPGANLHWENTQKGTISGSDGRFIISSKNIKSKKLVVSFVGYKTKIISVDNSSQQLEIVLVANKTLKEVNIVSKKAGTHLSRANPIHTNIITGDELCKAACCNLSESFETNASVDVAYSDAVSGAKRIQLLGLSGIYSQLLIENMPNLKGLASAYGLSYVPGAWMESIQVSKGAASVVNGYESVTGQINVEYKKPDKSEKVYLNIFGNASGKVETNINTSVLLNKNWSTMILAHVEDMSVRHDNNDDSFLDMPLVRQYNFINRWKYQSGKAIITQFGIRYLDEERTGGQTNFRREDANSRSNFYGICINTKRLELFNKTGYVFPNDNDASIALLTEYTLHEQNAFFGLKNYSGDEKSFYSNLVYQNTLERHKITSGATFSYSDIKESLNTEIFDRNENVLGAFFQYTYNVDNDLIFLAGIRADHHSKHGLFFTPRIHLKYKFLKNTTLRLSAGMGYRTANIIAENSYVLASSRDIIIAENLDMEQAWNYGLNLTQRFIISDKELTINIEFYHTNFDNQIVVDTDSDVSKLSFYNLNGKSYANNYQIEGSYELFRGFDLTAAIRISDVKVTYNGELKDKAFVNKYKGLITASYVTNLKKWQFDIASQFNGNGRIPSTSANPETYRLEETYSPFTIINAQITKYFRIWSIYIGVENITNFTQKNPIIAADNPFGENFDATMIWGPIHGRKFFAGIRFAIERE